MSRSEIETVLGALRLGLEYTRDAEDIPERFHPAVVHWDVAQIKAAMALMKRALGGAT